MFAYCNNNPVMGYDPTGEYCVANKDGTDTNYLSCGPYRIESVSEEQILLTPNPNWTGATAAFEQVSCRPAS